MLTSLWPVLTGETAARVSEHQLAALTLATSRPFGLLTGTPGTGKTHTTGVLVSEVVRRHGDRSLAVCAPTGKAAVRLTAAMNRQGAAVIATTIHQLLEIGRNGHDGDGWGFQRNEDNPLDQRFVVVDEASMLDTDLAADLLRACAPGTHVLWIGDPFQLPPVGHGAPLRDMIASGSVPNGHLTEIRRNAGMIVHACAAIKDGKPFETITDRGQVAPSEGRNLWHIEASNPAAQIAELLDLYAGIKKGGKRDPLWDIQVIVATNKSGELGRRAVNDRLQAELNPDGERATGNPFRVGDKIICLRNHWCIGGLENDPLTVDRHGEHYIANGEIGQVLAVASKITGARFSNPTRVVRITMGKGAADDGDDGGAGSGAEDGESKGRSCNYDLAYAITGHKSQGSEWPIVVVLIDASPGARYVCSRNWIYTVLSRASALCVTIGRRGALEMMVKRDDLNRRKTFLKELLCQA